MAVSIMAKRWSIEDIGMSTIDHGLRGVAVTYSDWSDAVPLSGDERQALKDAKSGKKSTKLSSSGQRALVRKAKEAEKKHRYLWGKK